MAESQTKPVQLAKVDDKMNLNDMLDEDNTKFDNCDGESDFGTLQIEVGTSD
jgi:hypothetical protein